MEHVAVRRVWIVAAIDFSWDDDAYGRLLFFHGTNLHGRSVRAQQMSAARSLDVESVHVVARGMVLGNVERLEIVVRRLDFGPSTTLKPMRKDAQQLFVGLSDEAAGEQSAAAGSDKIDLSLPGIERAIGTRHLIRQTYDELLRIFTAIGFSVVAGPEIETPYYNFEALNIPEHHPARDNMDTFYIAGARGGHLLRTHTSPMQIRTMEKQKPPVRIVVPGKVYRRDNPDATHGYMFHQIEGLAVDTDITFCDFKGTVDYFVREFLGPKTKTRLRPSYFPFTEPSAEVDASCHVCGGTGCRVCKQSGWIELFGAGMVNPAVYGFVRYDAEKFQASRLAWALIAWR